MLKHGIYSLKEKFDLPSWRNFLNDVARSVHKECQVISPFGFEVSHDPKYLTGNLLNFFIYLGIVSPDPLLLSDVRMKFTRQLISSLNNQYPILYHEIHQVIIEQQKIIISNDETKSIYVKCRTLNGNLLEEYSYYILSTIGGVINRQIKAIIEFEKDPLSRRYLFQLCIILHYIFKDFDAGLPSEHIPILINLIRSLHDAEYLNLSRTDTNASYDQFKALNTIVLPYFQILYDLISHPYTNTDVITSLSILDFHGYNQLTVNISEYILKSRSNYIMKSYLLYE